jgi:hypothetical protein
MFNQKMKLKMSTLTLEPKTQLRTKDEVRKFATEHGRKIHHLWYLRYEGTPNELLGMAAVIRLVARMRGCTVVTRLTEDEWHEIGTTY